LIPNDCQCNKLVRNQQDKKAPTKWEILVGAHGRVAFDRYASSVSATATVVVAITTGV
jgi:hypothetical protein